MHAQQKIIDVDINNEMQKSFMEYSMSVIVSRALPDVRDGLKPVHRRILYTMYEKGLGPEKPYRKCADTVGAVLGSYHPHGDASVYDALVRLAQDFSMRYMLVDGHGNFGSVDGDPPAAYRYTEAKMSKMAVEMLTDIDKETVDFMPNFDDRLKEPTVLPSRFPNLLVNGSSGIAVGMATNIPPHNMGEVIDAICCLIDNPDARLEDLMQHIQGPDFPTGALIMGRSGIRAAYATGRGKIIVRARAEIVEQKNGRFKIIVTELPYQVNKARLVESIANLVKDKRIEGISNVEDHSDRAGIGHFPDQYACLPVKQLRFPVIGAVADFGIGEPFCASGQANHLLCIFPVVRQSVMGVKQRDIVTGGIVHVGFPDEAGTRFRMRTDHQPAGSDRHLRRPFLQNRIQQPQALHISFVRHPPTQIRFVEPLEPLDPRH